MTKQLLMTAILAFGMGFAQAQNPPNPGQGGAPDNTSGTSKARQEAPLQQGASTQSAAGTAVDQAGPAQTFKGCLTGSSGSWSLAADNGQALKLSGPEDQLSTHGNQQVSIQGTQASDGTVNVTSIDKISDSCSATGQAATGTSNAEQNTATSGQAPATSSTTAQPPASSSTGAMNSQSTTTSNTQSTTSTTTGQTPAASEAAPSQSTTGAQTGAASTTTPSTGTPPVSEQTPSSTVGGNTSDQGAAQQPPASTTGQGATATGQSAIDSGQSGNVPHISDMDQNQSGTAGNQAAGQNAGQQKLPQTASPLPLLGLMGLGSLLTGLVARRRK
jgi:hypothetical protein